MTHKNLPATDAPVAPGLSAGGAPVPPAPLAESATFTAPHDATTVAEFDLHAPNHLQTLDLAAGPLLDVRDYYVFRVDACDVVNHKLQTSQRWRAETRDGTRVAFADGMEEAVQALQWLCTRAAPSTIPPAFRRRPDNDVELEVVR